MINKLKFTSITICYFFVALLSVSQGADEVLKPANDIILKYRSNVKFLGKVEELKVKVDADINNEDFSSITNLVNLKTLDLTGSVDLNEERIKSIALLTSLTKLDLTDCKKNKKNFLKGEDLTQLSSLTNLEILSHKSIKIDQKEVDLIRGKELKFIRQ